MFDRSRQAAGFHGRAGVFTLALIGHGIAANDLLVLELNEALYQHLRARFVDAHVVCGDTYERRKPDALPLLRTAEQFGCLPRDLLMIGDSINDVASARAAGCPILCVPYGYNEGQPVDNLDFDGMIPTLMAACDWIEARHGRSRSPSPSALSANRP